MKQPRIEIKRPFIVVAKDEDGRIRPSRNPHSHNTVNEAVIEAERLHVATGGTYFLVFGVVGSSSTTPGRLTRGQKRRIQKWQDRQETAVMSDVLDSVIFNKEFST